MSELEKQVLMSLIDMMKAGGQYATIGVVGYFIYKLIYISIIGGFIWATLRLATSCLVTVLDKRLAHKATKISLLSEQCNSSINTVMDSLQKSLSEFQSFVESQKKSMTEKAELKTDSKKK